MHISAREEARVSPGYFCLKFTLIKLQMAQGDIRPGEVASRLRSWPSVQTVIPEGPSAAVIVFEQPQSLDDIDLLIDSLREWPAIKMKPPSLAVRQLHPNPSLPPAQPKRLRRA